VDALDWHEHALVLMSSFGTGGGIDSQWQQEDSLIPMREGNLAQFFMAGLECKAKSLYGDKKCLMEGLLETWHMGARIAKCRVENKDGKEVLL